MHTVMFSFRVVILAGIFFFIKMSTT